MRYFGGKNRIATHITEVIAANGHKEVAEPFCGGLSVTIALRKSGIVVHPSDGNRALIAMYQAMAGGWEPNATVSEEDYVAAKALEDSDPLKAFIGIGCSFSGKWFGGMARSDDGRNYARNAANSLKRKFKELDGVNFTALEFQYLMANPAVAIYCDPPYAGTTGYSGLPKWDSEYFWKIADGWARVTNVYVSEYAAPDGWAEIWSKSVLMDTKTRAGKESRIERLFHKGPTNG